MISPIYGTLIEIIDSFDEDYQISQDYDKSQLDEFKKMLSVRENLLFFQKSIFKDR